MNVHAEIDRLIAPIKLAVVRIKSLTQAVPYPEAIPKWLAEPEIDAWA